MNPPDNYNYEVLIVDDDLNAAQDYVELVNTKTSLKCICTSDPKEAESIMAYCDIKIVILDQKMPKISGTELLPKLKPYDELAKFIMLTGEATSEEIGDAVNKGFVAYVRKENLLTQLVPKVIHYYIQYGRDYDKYLVDKRPIFLRPLISLFRIRRLYKIEDKVITKEFEDQDRVQIVASIHEGQKVATKYSLEENEEYVIENEEELGFEPILQHIDWVKSINTQIKLSIKKTLKKSRTFSTERKVDYSLPEGTGKRILKREIKRIPLYSVHKISFGVKPLIGGRMRTKTAIVRIFTHTYREIQVDYYEAKKSLVSDLGKVQL